VKLSEVIPWGRSFEEYCRLFALSGDDLAGTILGCADGPAGFNAGATARGHRVVSCDPLYALAAADVERRIGECYGTVLAQVRQDPDAFVWDFFRDPDHLGACRLAAMRRFLDDFDRGKREGRYLASALPALPFPDGHFSLAIVSHFLFLYSGHLDLEFHLASCRELLRVAGELRVFPLLDLDRKVSAHVGPVREHLEQAGFDVAILAVEYEFQKAEGHAGNRMMRVRRHRA
jgi:hypothetical protein